MRIKRLVSWQVIDDNGEVLSTYRTQKRARMALKEAKKTAADPREYWQSWIDLEARISSIFNKPSMVMDPKNLAAELMQITYPMIEQYPKFSKDDTSFSCKGKDAMMYVVGAIKELNRISDCLDRQLSNPGREQVLN